MKEQIKKLNKLKYEYYHLAETAWKKYELERRFEGESEVIDPEEEFIVTFSGRIVSITSTLNSVSYALGAETKVVEEDAEKLCHILDMLNELDALFDDIKTNIKTPEEGLLRVTACNWIAETFIYVARMQEFNLDELVNNVKTIKDNVYKLLE